MLFLIFVGALVYAIWEAGSHASKDVINQNKHVLPPAPGK
jgi:hypothetical protein